MMMLQPHDNAAEGMWFNQEKSTGPRNQQNIPSHPVTGPATAFQYKMTKLCSHPESASLRHCVNRTCNAR